jgi:glycosyltransferase involved in cell wall biosynthesis
MAASVLVSTPDLRPSLLSILQGLVENGLLARVATTISLSPRQIELFSRIPGLGSRLAQTLARRQTPPFLAGKIDHIWTRELLRNVSARIASPVFTHAVWEWAETSFDRTVARRYGGRFDLVYGMEHSSLATFERQKADGKLCVLRQVTAHARTLSLIVRRETERFPDLVNPYHRTLLAAEDKIVRRKEAEYALSDLIVANSDYVRKTFIANGVSPERIVAVPTGCPAADLIGARSGAGSQPLRFLYVGALSLRKGFPYLLEAWRSVDPGRHAELWIVGKPEFEISGLLEGESNIRHLGLLTKDELRDVYRQADVMVLPTLCEGLAHSVLEALSFGLPVVTTEASGAGNLIVSGENGLLVPEADADLLAAAIAEMIRRRANLPSMGARSVERARAWTVAQSNAEHLRRLQEFIGKRG